MNAPPIPPTDLPPPRGRTSGVGRIVAICVVLAVCGVAIFPGYYIEERIRGRMAWRRYEAEAKARGVKLDFADFIPPKIPDDQNFASIPIFEAAFRASDRGEKVPDPFELPKPAKGEVPKLSDPNKQTPIDLVAWQKYFVETKMLPAAGENAAADVLKALERYAAPLAQLHEGARRPHCRFPVRWERTLDAALPHFGLVQSAAKLYALRLAAHLQLGESAAACADFHDGLRLVTAVRAEPALISGLVRIGVTDMLLNSVWSGLATRQWADQELRKIDTDLGALDWLQDYQFTMSSERAAANEIFEALLTHRGMLIKLAHADFGSTEHKPFDDWQLLLYPSGWHYGSRIRLNRCYDELLARIDPAQHRCFEGRATPSAPWPVASAQEKLRQMAFWFTAPLLETMERRYSWCATVTDQARLGCALERFRLEHGGFPSALSELVPEFLSRMPAEVVNGEPYHYRRIENDSFVLYSVGMDLRDDGGVINPKLGSIKQLDWVWRYPAK